MSRSTRLASAGLVAAAVLAITACGSSTSSGGVAGATGTPATSAAPASAPASAAASAAPSGSGLNQAILQFQQANNSGITGGAIVTDLGNNQSAVTIGVVAAGVTDPMPANLAPGDCATMTAGGASAAPRRPRAHPARRPRRRPRRLRLRLLRRRRHPARRNRPARRSRSTPATRRSSATCPPTRRTPS